MEKSNQYMEVNLLQNQPQSGLEQSTPYIHRF